MTTKIAKLYKLICHISSWLYQRLQKTALCHYQNMLSEVDIEEEGMPWEGKVGPFGEKR